MKKDWIQLLITFLFLLVNLISVPLILKNLESDIKHSINHYKFDRSLFDVWCITSISAALLSVQIISGLRFCAINIILFGTLLSYFVTKAFFIPWTNIYFIVAFVLCTACFIFPQATFAYRYHSAKKHLESELYEELLEDVEANAEEVKSNQSNRLLNQYYKWGTLFTPDFYISTNLF